MKIFIESILQTLLCFCGAIITILVICLIGYIVELIQDHINQKEFEYRLKCMNEYFERQREFDEIRMQNIMREWD